MLLTGNVSVSLFSRLQITAVGDGVVALRLQEHHGYSTDVLCTGECPSLLGEEKCVDGGLAVVIKFLNRKVP